MSLEDVFIVYLLYKVSVGAALCFVYLGFVASAANCPLPPDFMPNKPLLQVSGKTNMTPEMLD